MEWKYTAQKRHIWCVAFLQVSYTWLSMFFKTYYRALVQHEKKWINEGGAQIF